jgi:signal peptidase I
MKPESIPFYGVGVAIALGAGWFFDAYDGYRFPESESVQYCKPQVEQDQFRWGRVTSRGDLQVIEPDMLVRYRTTRSRKELTSRVIALEGQRVKIEEGKVFVNGARVEDQYKRSARKLDYCPELIVPADCVFVLNDQRMRSGGDRMDSRAFGPIPLRAISHVFSPKDLKEGKRRR